MNQVQFLRRAQMLFNDFKFEVSSIGSIHGVKIVTPTTFRYSKTKSLIVLGNSREIYISGQMYPNTENDFIYCIIRTVGKKRGYRCRNWGGYEHNKLFVSAKNYELLYEKLKELVSEIKE